MKQKRVGIHVLEICPELSGCIRKIRYVQSLLEAKKLLNNPWLKLDSEYGSPTKQYRAGSS